MSQSSPEGIILGKGSKIISASLSINKEKVFEIKEKLKSEGVIVPYFISGRCKGEICSVCGKPATNKLGEEIPFDDPNKMRHNLTAYVCREHFTMIVGGC